MDENYYRRRFLIEFLNEPVSEEMMKSYMDNPNDCLELQDFISSNLYNHFTWMTGIGLIEAMDKIIESVKEQGDLNI